MDKESTIDSLHRFRLALESMGIHIQKLVLYGSYARGMAKETSDIDVLVISDDFSGKNYWERIDILSDAIYEIFEPIEAVALTVEEWEKGASVIVDYAKEGDIIFAA